MAEGGMARAHTAVRDKTVEMRSRSAWISSSTTPRGISLVEVEGEELETIRRAAVAARAVDWGAMGASTPSMAWAAMDRIGGVRSPGAMARTMMERPGSVGRPGIPAHREEAAAVARHPITCRPAAVPVKEAPEEAGEEAVAAAAGWIHPAISVPAAMPAWPST